MKLTNGMKACLAVPGGVLAVMLLAGPALAKGGGDPGPGPAFAPEDGDAGDEAGPPHGGHAVLKILKKFGQEIGVTDEQKGKIKALLVDFRDDVEPLKEEAMKLHGEMKAILEAKKIDKKAALAKHAEMQAVHQKIADRRFDLVLDVMDVLTADQRAKLFEILEECKPGPGKGKGKGGCFGKGDGPGMGKGMDGW